VVVVVALDVVVVVAFDVVVVVPAVVVVVPAVVVVVPAVVVVVVVVAVSTAFTMSSTVTCWGSMGVTPFGSKAMATRNSWENLMDDGFVVMVGVFCPNELQ
jgi:hypothetical protein